MATVKGPLMSIEASGKFARTLVFDRRGYARQYVIPRNPRSQAQQLTRLYLRAAQHAVSKLNATTVAAVKAAAPTSYRWNSWLVGKILGPECGTFTQLLAKYETLDSPTQEGWNTAATVAGIQEQTMTGTETYIERATLTYIVATVIFEETSIITAPLTSTKAQTLF